MVPDPNLGYRNPHPARQRCYVAMHFTVEIDLLHNFSAECFEGAAKVMQSNTG
jgi:hypothetical protein